MPDLPFTPCSPLCPAVTDKPHGSVRYCPMQENERHKASMKAHPEGGTMRLPNRPELLTEINPLRALTPAEKDRVKRREWKDWTWHTWDWRVERWVPGAWVDMPSNPDLVRWEPEIPPAPGATDCCANFQCCADEIKAAGLTNVFNALVFASDGGPSMEAESKTGTKVYISTGRQAVEE